MSRRVGDPVVPREIELKLHFPPGSRNLLEASAILAASESRLCQQITTYYDTPDCALSRAGLSLRVRQSGETRIQTVKSLVYGQSLAAIRKEFAWPIDQDWPEVDRLAEFTELATIAQLIRNRLEPVFVTDVHRTTRLLHLADDTDVEVAIDVGQIAAGTACSLVSELELELKRGNIRQMYRLAADLQQIAPMWISAESKSERGWHLRTGQTEGARRAQITNLGRRVLAADGLREIIDLKLGHLVANIGPTLSGNPEGVHQIRIALRGSRAVLSLFAGHLDATAVARFDDALKHFGLVFGEARDWDVFCLQTLPAAMSDLPAERIWDLHPAAEVERQAAHATVRAALLGPEFTALLLSMAIWLDAGSAQPNGLVGERMDGRLDRLAPSLLNRVARKTKKCSQQAGRLSEENLHRLRKALKKLFYDVEDLSGLFGYRVAKKYLHRCGALGALLGVSTDAVATQLLALNLVTESRQDLAQPAGALAKWSARRGRRARKKFLVMLPGFHDLQPIWS